MEKIKENNWHLIWNKKQLNPDLEPTLEQLIALDGFDSPFSGMNKTEFWLSYIENIANKLQITSNDSIFEVGCGAGAFLYPFYQQGNQVAGIDYSSNLVNISKKAIPQGNIIVGEAIDIPLNNRFDF
ncbi:MAG TPA: methyltransferase domain-containing protein, partial [Allocoleopsis sp.]